MNDMLFICLVLIVSAIGVGVIVGLLVGIPTFLISLGLRVSHALKEQKMEAAGCSEDDVRIASEIKEEYEKIVKNYNIEEPTMQNELLDKIAKSKGYIFKDGTFVKEVA